MDEFVAWLWNVSYWHWWAIAVGLVLIEVFAPSTLLLWPAASAFAVGVVVLFVPDFDWRFQVLLFAVLAVATSILWQMWLRRHPTESDHPQLNIRGQSYVGRRIRTDSALEQGHGRVRIEDTSWLARTEDSATVPADTLVEVIGADGSTLIVRAVVE
jgi:membrane protein implicated in regulation of membrane protease activity